MTAIVSTGGELYSLETVDDFENGTVYGSKEYGYQYMKHGLPSRGVNSPFIPENSRRLWPDRISVDYGMWIDRWVNGSGSSGHPANDYAGFKGSYFAAKDRADTMVWIDAEFAITFFLPEGESDPISGNVGANSQWVATCQSVYAGRGSKKLILDGTTISTNTNRPSPQMIANNIAMLKTLPFDGLMVMAKTYTEDFNGDTSLFYRTFSSKAISSSLATSIMAPMSGLSYGNLTDNMLLFITAPTGGPPFLSKKIDFFDSWRNIVQNVYNVVSAGAAVGMTGVIIDNEDYGSGWSSYEAGTYKNIYTIQEYRDQAFLRGMQVGDAIIKAMPNAFIMTMQPPVFSIPTNSFYATRELAGSFTTGLAEATGQSQVGIVDNGGSTAITASTSGLLIEKADVPIIPQHLATDVSHWFKGN